MNNAREQLACMRKAYDLLPCPLAILDRTLRIRYANPQWRQAHALSDDHASSARLHELGDGRWGDPPVRAALEGVFAGDRPVTRMRTRARSERGGFDDVAFSARRLPGFDRDPLVLLTLLETTAPVEHPGGPGRSGDRYADLVEQINSIIIGLSTDGTITFFNRFSEKLFGYSRDEVIGAPLVGAIIPPIDSQGADNRELVRHINAAPDRFYARESEGVCKDGSLVWFSWSAKKRTEAGEHAILIDGNDLTELVIARRTIEHKSATLDALLDSIPEGIMITDAQNIVVSVSRRLGELLDMPAEKLLHTDETTRAALMHMSGDRGEAASPESFPLSRAFSTGQAYTDVNVVVKRDGSARTLSVNAAPIRDAGGEIVGAVSGLRDVTEQQRRTREIRQRKRLLDALLEYTPAGIMLVDAAGVITEASARLTQLLDLPAAALLGRVESPARWGILDPNTRKTPHYHFMPLCKAIRQRKVITDQPYLLVRGERERVVAISAGPVLNDLGGVVGGVSVWRDITEKRRAEEALIKSERLFRAAVDNYTSVFVIYDNQRRIQFINKFGVELAGVPEKRILGNRDEAFIPAEVSSRYIPRLETAMQTGEKQHFEYTFTLNGAEYTHIVDYVPLRDRRGELSQILGITVDITERKAIERRLRDQTARLDATLEAIPDGYLVYAPDRSIVRINAVAREILNYSERQMGLSFDERTREISACDAAGTPIPIRQIPSNRAFAGEIVRNEVIGIERPGARYWLSISAAPIRGPGGEMAGAILLFSDITGQRMLQEQLADERNFVDAVLQTSGALITVLDPQARFVRFNSACEKLTGYAAREVIGRSVFDLFVAPEERAGVEEVAARLLAGQAMVEHDNHWRTRDGGRRFIRWRNTALTEHGETAYAIATGIDITDRKLLEEKLNRRNDDLRQANRDLESFSYSVSHDLRGPLRAAGGLIDILSEDYAERLPDEGREYVRHIAESIAKMQNLIDDLLNLSRVSRHDIERDEVDLSRIVEDYLRELHQSEPGRSAEFIVQRQVRARADPRLIPLALFNLLRNAWKFSARRERIRIEFGVSYDNQTPVYFIRDNGAGFDMHDADSLFEPFKRMHPDREFSGTGVGLSIVNRIIARHGGRIWARSEIDKGATFYFTLNEKR
jgi:PAS domain S-box-containing protein